MMPRTNITKQTTRGQIRASKLVPITPPALMNTLTSLKEAMLLHSTRNRGLLAMARLKDMLGVLISIKISQKMKILHLDKIKYLFIWQDTRGKSAISMSIMEPASYSLTDPPRHQPTIPAPMVATPTSKTLIWLKICHHHSLPEHLRVSSLTQMSSTTSSETTCLHSPGKRHTTPLISVIMITSQTIQLRPPALRRRGSVTMLSE